MSLILDALRKSERSRQQSLTGRVSATDGEPARARIPVPWATLIGLLLIVNAVVLGIIFWRSHASRSAAVAVVAPPNTAASETSTPVYRPAVRSLAAEAAGAGSAPASVQAAPASNTPAAAGVLRQSSASAAAVGATAASGAVANPAATDLSTVNPDNAPPLDTLPLAFQQALPPLHLDVHSYSANPAERFVVINMQRYRKGDTLKAGPQVLAIVPNGVVLEYQGQTFLLPRN